MLPARATASSAWDPSSLQVGDLAANAPAHALLKTRWPTGCNARAAPSCCLIALEMKESWPGAHGSVLWFAALTTMVMWSIIQVGC